jgi:hypothetical protein
VLDRTQAPVLFPPAKEANRPTRQPRRAQEENDRGERSRVFRSTFSKQIPMASSEKLAAQRYRALSKTEMVSELTEESLPSSLDTN